MAADLEAVKAIDPSVNDLGEIGGDFIRLIENGIDAKTAFLAVKTASDGKHSPLPPETGSIGVTESAQSEFFTSKELDRLTSRDLENPLIFKKALKSLKKL